MRQSADGDFAFPGIWRRYQGPVRKDGPNVEIEVYSFLTTTPNAMVATINHERMPVLLTRKDEFETWLKGTAGEALALAREYSPEQMRICGRASTRKTTFERRNRTAARCSVPLNGAGVPSCVPEAQNASNCCVGRFFASLIICITLNGADAGTAIAVVGAWAVIAVAPKIATMAVIKALVQTTMIFWRICFSCSI